MERLTELGFHLLDLPLEPQWGKMVLYSVVLKCLDPILTIVCTLAHRDPCKLVLAHFFPFLATGVTSFQFWYHWKREEKLLQIRPRRNLGQMHWVITLCYWKPSKDGKLRRILDLSDCSVLSTSSIRLPWRWSMGFVHSYSVSFEPPALFVLVDKVTFVTSMQTLTTGQWSRLPCLLVVTLTWFALIGNEGSWSQRMNERSDSIHLHSCLLIQVQVIEEIQTKCCKDFPLIGSCMKNWPRLEQFLVRKSARPSILFPLLYLLVHHD